MTAVELLEQLRSLVRHHGDLEVVVDVDVVDGNQVFPLTSTVELDRFEPDGPNYLVLITQPLELP